MIERGEEQNKRPGQTTGSPLFMFVKNGKRNERERKKTTIHIQNS